MENDNTGSVFINGRAQILEMFQYLEPQERERLIKQIRPRNPQLAEEIVETSITFNSILNLDDSDITKVLQYIKAPILGVALKSLNITGQRRVLSLCDREYAEKAFQVMNTRLSNENRDVERACSRVKSIISALSKKKMIRL